MNAIDFNQIKSIVSRLSGVPEKDIHKDSALIEDLHLDSLKFVELMAIMAEEFQAEIKEEDALNIQTVGQLHQFVEQSQP